VFVRFLILAGVIGAVIIAPAIGEAQSQQRTERSNRQERRSERSEPRERPERTDRPSPTNQRSLECPTGVTCRMVCMWSGGRREYDNVRSATVTYVPGGSGAIEVSVRGDEGQPLGMVFGTGLTCVGESVRPAGG
jgi:hypothetical protein